MGRSGEGSTQPKEYHFEVNIMAIKLNYNNKDYTLDFNRATVRQLEAQGFEMGKVTDQPSTMVPMLFMGSFARYHKGIKRNLVDEIYDNISNKTDLLTALLEMYSDTLNDLIGDNEAVEGNVTWTKE